MDTVYIYVGRWAELAVHKHNGYALRGGNFTFQFTCNTFIFP